MRRFLLDNGLRADMKFAVQEMWDYTTSMLWFPTPLFRKEIYFMGSGKIDGIDNWNYKLQLKLCMDSRMQGPSVQHIERLSPEELIIEISKGGFGLVWHQDEDSRQGMKYGISFDLSRYFTAGIPVIVPRGISHQDLIEKNHLGWVVDSLDEAVEQVENMDEADYQECVRYVRKFSPLIRNGYFTKKFL